MSHYWEDILNLLPVFCTAKYSNVVVRFLYSSPLPCPVALRSVTKQHGKKAAFQSSSLCFVQRNIGEVSEGRRG